MTDEKNEPAEPVTEQDPASSSTEEKATKAAPAAKKAPAKKPAAAKAEGDTAAEKKPAAKKPAAKKPAAAKAEAEGDKPAAKKAPAKKAPAKSAAADAGDEAASEAPAKPKAPARRQPAAKKAEAEAAQPAQKPRPTRSRRNAPAEKITVRAHAKYIRSSARKARLVCDHIREQPVEKARAILEHSPRAVARDWSKLLESAVANAEHNHALDAEDLKIVAVFADEGPTLKRFQPRAQGRAFRIRKRTSHLTILLGSKE
jgi:ribosomal protein L22